MKKEGLDIKKVLHVTSTHEPPVSSFPVNLFKPAILLKFSSLMSLAKSFIQMCQHQIL